MRCAPTLPREAQDFRNDAAHHRIWGSPGPRAVRAQVHTRRRAPRQPSHSWPHGLWPRAGAPDVVSLMLWCRFSGKRCWDCLAHC